jgi:hypothetical protein
MFQTLTKEEKDIYRLAFYRYTEGLRSKNLPVNRNSRDHVMTFRVFCMAFKLCNHYGGPIIELNPKI